MTDDIRACETCLFWGVEGIRKWNDEGDEVRGPQHRCLRVEDGGHGRHADAGPDVPAFTCDGSGYVSTFWTLPTFGCVLWEHKP